MLSSSFSTLLWVISTYLSSGEGLRGSFEEVTRLQYRAELVHKPHVNLAIFYMVIVLYYHHGQLKHAFLKINYWRTLLDPAALGAREPGCSSCTFETLFFYCF